MEHHTILLLQSTPDKSSRYYETFRNVDECMKGLISRYESELRKSTPGADTITYNMEDLYNYLDSLEDVVCLVFQSFNKTYATYTKAFIRNKLYSVIVRSSDNDDSPVQQQQEEVKVEEITVVDEDDDDGNDSDVQIID